MVVVASDWYISIQLCSSENGSSKVCCGSDYTCCDETGVYDLPVFTAISKPPGLARATSSGTSSMSSAAATTTTQNSTQTETSAATAGDGGAPTKVYVGLGVGLGIPLVLALLATGFILLRGRQHQKIKPKNNRKPADATFQLDPPMMHPVNDQLDDAFSPQDQQLLQHSGITELSGRGTDVSRRNAQELSGH